MIERETSLECVGLAVRRLCRLGHSEERCGTMRALKSACECCEFGTARITPAYVSLQRDRFSFIDPPPQEDRWVSVVVDLVIESSRSFLSASLDGLLPRYHPCDPRYARIAKWHQTRHTTPLGIIGWNA